jgi:hypothetical protein
MMNTPDLTPATCLMLNAGQLAYPSDESRAIALALACLTDEQEFNGATGTGHMPEVTDLIDLAQELLTVKLDESSTLHALDVLVAGGYLEAPIYDFRTPYRVNTTTLPMRYTLEDCPAPLEHDVYGYGDH